MMDETTESEKCRAGSDLNRSCGPSSWSEAGLKMQNKNPVEGNKGLISALCT